VKPKATLTVIPFLLISIAIVLYVKKSAPPRIQHDDKVARGTASGHAALQFDESRATDFLFSTHDPKTGDLWTTHMTHVLRSESPYSWQISLAPGGETLGDDQANGSWITHLLETIRTAQLTPIIQTGSLESFGLSDPRVLIKWIADEQVYELHLGEPDSPESEAQNPGVYGLIAAAPNSVPELSQTVYRVRGALIKMLEMVSSFDSLRLKTLAPFAAEEIQSIEVISAGKSVYKSHRKSHPESEKQNEEWAPVSFLEQLFHLRIENFVDDLSLNAQINEQLKSQPLYILKLKGAKAGDLEFRFGGRDGRVVASVSSRSVLPAGPLSVFEIPPEILGALAVLLR
jgi:hypothetical protein